MVYIFENFQGRVSGQTLMKFCVDESESAMKSVGSHSKKPNLTLNYLQGHGKGHIH